MTLRAGLVGLGAMGRHHARLLRTLEEFDFVGAVDPDGDRFGALVSTPVFDSVADIIELGVDVAVVAVPTIRHEAIALELAASGVHTLVEKPLADSIDAATRVAEAFRTSGVVGVVGQVERFNPALIELRRRLRDTMGSVLLVIRSRRR